MQVFYIIFFIYYCGMKTKREKPGRKPIKDKVEGITIYVKKSVIKRMGGKSNCRGILLVEVEKW